jgi:serine/threonine protein kinase
MSNFQQRQHLDMYTRKEAAPDRNFQNGSTRRPAGGIVNPHSGKNVSHSQSAADRTKIGRFTHMPLTAGDRLGPYEILAPIGAGGMGEVYRARDGKLGRDVALKVLPQAFAAAAERMARFRREAQVLAPLNHSGIVAIYGFEDSSQVHALVMELVEGPTLAIA